MTNHIASTGERETHLSPILFFNQPNQVTPKISANHQDNTPAVESRSLFTELSRKPLTGELIFEGVGHFLVVLYQYSRYTQWCLLDSKYINKDITITNENLIAALKIKVSGETFGYGEVNILISIVNILKGMIALASCSTSKTSRNMSGQLYSYTNQDTGEYISFITDETGRRYHSLSFKSNGISTSLTKHSKQIRNIIDLQPIETRQSKAVSTVLLGIKTFDMLVATRGKDLTFLNKKQYYIVDTVEKFNEMMLMFLNDVQTAYNSNKAVMVGLDTETTGLNMYNLSKGNEVVDHIVSIPFAWRDNESFLICTDMEYISNVPEENVYSLFNTLFSRKPDFSNHNISLTFCGQQFNFTRNNILISGANTEFDIGAFLCHGVSIYFDEDILIAMYDFAPGLVKGHNSLKDWTHAVFQDETLELGELYGNKHKDKFRWLQDPKLAAAYACPDADYTRMLMKWSISKMPKAIRAQYKKYDIPVRNILGKASWNGMPVNSEKVKEDGLKVLENMETLQSFIYKYAYIAYRDNLTNKVDELARLLNIDKMSNQECEQAQSIAEATEMFRFEFKPNKLRQLLFSVLNYPILAISEDGRPSLNKDILKKLSKQLRVTPSNAMKYDLVSPNNPNEVLISAKTFNSKQYPLADVLIKYSEISKEYTAYYKPIVTLDLEGKMFYSFKMAYAATRRILSPGQTMKGSLKKLVQAPKGKFVLCFDASQIEFRLMASLAYQLKKKNLQQSNPNNWQELLKETAVYGTFSEMQKPEADYHIATAATILNKKLHLVTHSERKSYKTVGFGIPYGLSVHSLATDLYGNPSEENISKTQDLMDNFVDKQKEIIELLESTRDSVFIPNNPYPEITSYLNIDSEEIGMVQNLVGCNFLFNFSNRSRKNVGRIRRQVGNIIIQGGAAELHRRMILNLHMALVKHNLHDKFNIFMVVHDEEDCTIDSDIDILLLIKIIHENCTLRYTDHIPYYVGIGFGYSWGEAKDDSAELPVIMVERLIEAYDKGYRLPCDGNQPNYLLTMKRHYYCDRIGEVLQEIIPNIHEGFTWTEEHATLIDEKFENYIVRAYLPAFVTDEVSKLAKQENRSPTLLEQLQCWQQARDEYGFNVKFTDVIYTTKSNEVDLTGNIDLTGNDNLIVDELDLTGDNLILDNEDMELNYNDLNFNVASLRSSITAGDEEDKILPDVLNSDILDYGDDDSFISETDSDYRLLTENKDEEELYTINETPKDAYDLYAPTKYIRSSIFKTTEDTFTVMLNGEHSNNAHQIADLIKSKADFGSQTFIIAGNTTKIVSHVYLTDDSIDQIDKYLSNKE